MYLVNQQLPTLEVSFNLQSLMVNYFTRNLLSHLHPIYIPILPIFTFFNIDIDFDSCSFSLSVFSLLALFVLFDDVQIESAPEEKHVE